MPPRGVPRPASLLAHITLVKALAARYAQCEHLVFVGCQLYLCPCLPCCIWYIGVVGSAAVVLSCSFGRYAQTPIGSMSAQCALATNQSGTCDFVRA